MTGIQFNCPTCRQLIEADESDALKLIDCPKCASSIEVPLPHLPAPRRPVALRTPGFSTAIPMKSKPGPSGIGLLGFMMAVAGFAAGIYFFVFYETSVPIYGVEGIQRVQNLGLMQERQLGLVVAITAFVLGFICLIVDYVQTKR